MIQLRIQLIISFLLNLKDNSKPFVGNCDNMSFM